MAFLAASFNGSFFGNGGGVTNVNVTNLTGVLADNQLPANTAFVNSNQTFSGANIFTNFNNSFQGSFFGNGLVGWIATNGTAIQAVIDHGYLLTNPQLVTVTLPASANPGDIVRISGAGASGWQVRESSGQSILGNFASYSNSSPVDRRTVLITRTLPPRWTAPGCMQWAAALQVFWFPPIPVTLGVRLALCLLIVSPLPVQPMGKLFMRLQPSAPFICPPTVARRGQVISSGATAISCTADGSQYFTGNIACSGNGTYRAQFTSSSISVSTNAGASYSALPVTAVRNLTCLAVSGDCNRLVAGVSNGLLYGSANLGATWTSITTTNQFWSGAWMSEDGSKFAATVSNNGSTTGGIYDYAVNAVPNTISTNSTISGSQGTAVELQCIGNNQWMPVSSSGTIWAY